MKDETRYAVCLYSETLGWVPAMHTPPQFATAPLVEALRRASRDLQNITQFEEAGAPMFEFMDAAVARIEAALARANDPPQSAASEDAGREGREG